MWKLSFTHKARKDLLSLNKDLQKRIIGKLEQTLGDPAKAFERLSGSDYSKLRAGDYRIIALIRHQTEEVIVQRIGNRENIYEKI